MNDPTIMDTTASDSATASSSTSTPKRLPTTVTKPIPYTFDLGNLLCNDANPVVPGQAGDTHLSESDLAATARDCAQVLLNQLLSTCPISRSSDNTSVALTLPNPNTPMPRAKPVPSEKPRTKWQQFAEKKGITGKKKEGKLVFDEEKGDWVPKWGYKGKNKDGEGDWLVEIDEKKERAAGEGKGDARAMKREERKDRIRRQERRERANERRGTKA